MLKLVEVTSGYQTNWHSILEQTTGLFNGIAIAVVVAHLAVANAVARQTAADHRPWTEPFALGFVLLGITYLNLRKNVAQWVGTKSMPAEMAGLSAWAWFNWEYVAFALVFFLLWMRHTKRPLAVIPPTWSGKGQALYLGLLWWLVAGNFERGLVAFRSERLVTEGVLYLVALACTLVLLLETGKSGVPTMPETLTPAVRGRSPLAATVAVGLAAATLSIVADWAIVRAIYGDRFAGHSRLHTRFGSTATTNPLKTVEPFAAPVRCAVGTIRAAIDRTPRPVEHRQHAPTQVIGVSSVQSVNRLQCTASAPKRPIRRKSLEVVGQLVGRVVTILRIPRHGLHDDCFQVRGKLRIEQARRDRLGTGQKWGESRQRQIVGDPKRPIQGERLAERESHRMMSHLISSARSRSNRSGAMYKGVPAPSRICSAVATSRSRPRPKSQR